jgi:hypothetical protein
VKTIFVIIRDLFSIIGREGLGVFSKKRKQEMVEQLLDSTNSTAEKRIQSVEEAEQEKTWVLSTIKAQVYGGYTPREEIIEYAEDMIEDIDGLQLDSMNEVDKVIACLVKEQKSWPKQTDYDRLNTAMLKLEQNGIVARQNFTCCGTCGQAEIVDEVDEYNLKASTSARGYVFFHEQGTEGAVDGEDLNFSYGAAFEGATEEQDVAIGQELADTMKEAGLTVDWDGTLSMCVMVGLDWKRRWNPA